MKQTEDFFSAKLSIIKTIFRMVRLELKLAGLSVYPLLLNLCGMLIISFTLWVSTMVLLGYFVLLASQNFLLSGFFILLLNLGLFLGLLKYLAFNLKNMSFEKTRDYFFENKSIDNEKLETGIKKENCNNKQDIAIPNPPRNEV